MDLKAIQVAINIACSGQCGHAHELLARIFRRAEEMANAFIEGNAQGNFLCAIRAIPAGHDVLVAYGPVYWLNWIIRGHGGFEAKHRLICYELLLLFGGCPSFLVEGHVLALPFTTAAVVACGYFPNEQQVADGFVNAMRHIFAECCNPMTDAVRIVLRDMLRRQAGVTHPMMLLALNDAIAGSTDNIDVLISLLKVDRLSSAAIIAFAAMLSGFNGPLLDSFYARGYRVGGDTRAAFDATIAALPTSVPTDGLIELLARVSDDGGLPFSLGVRVKVHGLVRANELNGRVGEIVSAKALAEGRVAVLLDGAVKMNSIRTMNLRRI